MKTEHKNYLPTEIDYKDRVILRIRQMMEPYHFAERDIKLVIQLWSVEKDKFKQFFKSKFKGGKADE